MRPSSAPTVTTPSGLSVWIEDARLNAVWVRVGDGVPTLVWGERMCGAWGGCTLPPGHNKGRLDIPENHR